MSGMTGMPGPLPMGMVPASLGMEPAPLGMEPAPLGMEPAPLGMEPVPLGMEPVPPCMVPASLGMEPAPPRAVIGGIPIPAPEQDSCSDKEHVPALIIEPQHQTWPMACTHPLQSLSLVHELGHTADAPLTLVLPLDPAVPEPNLKEPGPEQALAWHITKATPRAAHNHFAFSDCI